MTTNSSVNLCAVIFFATFGLLLFGSAWGFGVLHYSTVTAALLMEAICLKTLLADLSKEAGVTNAAVETSTGSDPKSVRPVKAPGFVAIYLTSVAGLAIGLLAAPVPNWSIADRMGRIAILTGFLSSIGTPAGQTVRASGPILILAGLLSIFFS